MIYHTVAQILNAKLALIQSNCIALLPPPPPNYNFCFECTCKFLVLTNYFWSVVLFSIQVKVVSRAEVWKLIFVQYVARILCCGVMRMMMMGLRKPINLHVVICILVPMVFGNLMSFILISISSLTRNFHFLKKYLKHMYHIFSIKHRVPIKLQIGVVITNIDAH